MSGGRSPRTATLRAPLAWTVAILGLLLPLTAAGDPRVPPRCTALDDEPGYCIGVAALRLADADSAQLPHVLAELRVAEQRLVVARADSEHLALALQTQSQVVLELRRQVESVRPWLPGWAYMLIGGGLVSIAGLIVWAL